MIGSAFAFAERDFGTPVPDSVAGDLRGGCAGTGPAQCGGFDLPCAMLCVTNGPKMDEDPNSVIAWWCSYRVNHENVCYTCSANAVSCGG